MKRITTVAVVFVLLLTCVYATKEATKKNRKSKQSVPQIECAIKAAKIINPEFIAKCPLGCQDVKYRVYGTDIYASFSSVCAAAIHSGIIDNSGGKVLVQKVAGQSGYKGSFSNGIRSLSLPRWRESFILSEGKPKRGVQYPSTLTYSSSESTVTKGNSLRKGSQTTAAPLPATHGAAHTFKPFTTTTEFVSPTPKTTVTSTTIAPTTFTKVTTVTVAKPLIAVHKVRDLGSSNVHPVYSAMAAAASASRQVQAAQGRTQNQATETDAWKSGSSLLDPGFSSKEDIVPKPLKPVSQGNPNCKVDLAFLIDGSWSIGRRRFQIQKQFLKDVSQALNVGPIGPFMGIVQYGDNPSTEFNLKAYANTKDLKNAIEKISQKGGLSNVGKALSFVNKNYFEDANGNRGGAPNVAVVLVDGWPTDKVEEASRLARESGINIFFVTIEGPDENEKKNVIETNFVDKAVCRTNGYYSIHVTSWFTLYKVVQPLVKRICDVDRLACSKTCLNSADIGFVIDGSSSVGTDGRSYDDVRGPALAAHQNGVIAYSIGIAWAAQDELEAVATDPDKEHSFFVDEFDRLYRFVPKIVQNICTEFNSQPRN
ncbi:vitrin isoform X2 [Pantherophis guttatus]|uniref:Vitrin isoform X2 n=1 Tax=Pantherophis guttatus TaxID=94885 RepID=A0A6P9CI33_PANGU|nr:vitrin isoform X2 [Pantherophis guttatus]